ncbi:hypothetical protein F4679DRAFT_532304 [Xylaria curta]|nr:hypothetical protein F4679DRAFT_532304 [Xylaria curta]
MELQPPVVQLTGEGIYYSRLLLDLSHTTIFLLATLLCFFPFVLPRWPFFLNIFTFPCITVATVSFLVYCLDICTREHQVRL